MSKLPVRLILPAIQILLGCWLLWLGNQQEAIARGAIGTVREGYVVLDVWDHGQPAHWVFISLNLPVVSLLFLTSRQLLESLSLWTRSGIILLSVGAFWYWIGAVIDRARGLISDEKGRAPRKLRLLGSGAVCIVSLLCLAWTMTANIGGRPPLVQLSAGAWALGFAAYFGRLAWRQLRHSE